VRDFLLVNQSEGTEWFNKERFEALVGLLFLTAAVVSREKSSEPPVKDVIRFHRAARKMIDDAGSAGYRTDIFLKLSVSG
jgi:hypothetical protein